MNHQPENPYAKLHATPHFRAMDLAQEADMAHMHGDYAQARELFRQACDLEVQAIAAANPDVVFANELTAPNSERPNPADGLRALFFRSAAWLALDSGDPRRAEKLACQALAAEPDPGIAEELREILLIVYRLMPAKLTYDSRKWLKKHQERQQAEAAAAAETREPEGSP